MKALLPTQLLIFFLSQLLGLSTVIAQELPAGDEAMSPVLTELFNDMVFVEGGTFTMGATGALADDAESDEKVLHEVTLSPYYICRYEVTQSVWKAVMGKNPSNFKGDNLPVESVTWIDCQQFITRLNALTGKTFRLPTEAEWEYAARGGKHSKGFKYAGSDNPDEVAWHNGNSGGGPHPVGQKAPNELGLYDMSGNVYEWCSDWKGKYSSKPQTNPQGPVQGTHRVNRGGRWGGSIGACRVSDRSMCDPNVRFYHLGFRLALTPTDNKE